MAKSKKYSFFKRLFPNKFLLEKKSINVRSLVSIKSYIFLFKFKIQNYKIGIFSKMS